MGVLDVPFRESLAQRWARRYNGIVDRYPVMTSPPTLTMQGATSTVNANTAGNVSHRFDNPVLTHVGNLVINDGTNRGVGSSITFADNSKQASNSPIRTRFMTDAPVFEACFRGTQFAAIGAIVDGEYVARERLVIFPNDGNPHYVKFDFGANTRTYRLAQVSRNAAGTGYAVGDRITLAGGTFTTPAEVTVIQVSAGAISAIEVSNPGAYSVSTTTFTQASTTGAGTGATFSSPVWSARFTQRRMRRIELIWHGSGQKFHGINVDSQSTVLPYPVPDLAMKVAFIGDSIANGTYLDYAGAHLGLSIAQHMGLADRAEVNAIGGTGWATVNTSVSPNGPAWNDAKRVADFIALDADVYVWWGSQNDAAAGSAVVTSAVQSVLQQVTAAVPRAYHIGLGPVIVSGAPGTTLSAAVGAGFTAMGNDRKFRYLDSVSEAWLSGTGRVTAETSSGNKDFYLSSDNAHPGQNGLDYLAYQASARIAEELAEMVGN